MTERAILFRGEMVRSILAGTKTQTRRPVKPQPNNIPGKHHPIEPYKTSLGTWNWVLSATGHGTRDPFPCPYGQPGDRLWVRETWCFKEHANEQTPDSVCYRADDLQNLSEPWIWKPSIHMPRWASRITLEVVTVRVERVREITEEQAKAEGVEPAIAGQDGQGPIKTHRTGFVRGWNAIYPGSWDRNDWVWRIEFKRLP